MFLLHSDWLLVMIIDTTIGYWLRTLDPESIGNAVVISLLSCSFHTSYTLQVLPASLPTFWFLTERGSNFAQGTFLLVAATRLRLKNTRSNVEFSPISDLRLLILWPPVNMWWTDHPVHHIFTMISSFHLHSWWRHLITGWTNLKISSSFHHALLALYRNTPKRNGKFQRPL